MQPQVAAAQDEVAAPVTVRGESQRARHGASSNLPEEAHTEHGASSETDGQEEVEPEPSTPRQRVFRRKYMLVVLALLLLIAVIIMR